MYVLQIRVGRPEPAGLPGDQAGSSRRRQGCGVGWCCSRCNCSSLDGH